MFVFHYIFVTVSVLISSAHLKYAFCGTAFANSNLFKFGWLYYAILLGTSLEQFDESCNFVLHITEFVENLIRRKQLIEAVGFTCTFELTDKFSPVALLKQHVEDARKSYYSRWLEKESVDEKVTFTLL